MKYNKILITLILFLSGVTIYPQAIFDAVNEGNIDSVKKIIEAEPDQLNIKNPRGSTLLITAASKGNLDIVKYLIEKGADVNEVNNFKTSPLHFASFSNFHEIVKLLLENGADISFANNQGFTPIYFAVANGGYESAKLLLENGADLFFKDNSDKSLLHIACENGNEELVKFLMGKGLDAEAIDKFGKTSIYYAAEQGLKDVVDLIISKEIKNLTSETIDGSTYLHAAAKGGLIDFAKKIIEAGVDVNKANLFGLTPYSIAEETGNSKIVKLLAANGADSSEAKTKNGDYLGMELPGTVPVLFAPGIISTPDFNERDVTISLSGDEFYFTKWPVDRLWKIMVVKRNDDRWNNPAPVSFLKPYLHAEACFTPDDQKMFFISNRPASGEGPVSNWEIWFTERNDSDWNEPQLLGEEFKGGFYPAFTNDGTMYYTNSNADIGRAYLIDGEYKKIESLDSNVNSPLDEYNSFIAADESYLIFSVNGRDDSLGDGDLYICFKNDDGSWTKAKNMGPGINSWALDYCPAISRDGKYFFFSSRKFGTEDIFWVSTKILDTLRN